MPTEKQLAYAKDVGIDVPTDATMDDISALLTRYQEGDNSSPNAGLLDFATTLSINSNKYIGKKALYNLIFSTLAGEDKIAFFTFCIYRWLSDDRHGNLNTSNHKAFFYNFAKEHNNDEKFMNSMNKYRGQDLRFFGEITGTDGHTYTAGSNSTFAYKETADFISKTFNIPKTRKKQLNSNNNYYNKPLNKNNYSNQNKDTPNINKQGCLFIIILFFMLYLLISCVSKL